MRYKAIIFDLDGTLLNSIEDLANSVNYALKTLGFENRSIEEVKSFVGNGVEMLVKRALPAGVDEATFSRCRVLQREYYNEHKMDNTKAYDGIMELLAQLRAKGLLIGIVSNKYSTAVEALAEDIFKGYIDVAIGTNENIAKKPLPDGVYKAIEVLGVQKHEVVYVGDSEVDVQTARNAGIDIVGVSWGYRDRKVLEDMGVINIADNSTELRQYLI